LPSDAEWTTLINYLGGENVAGRKLKSTTGWFNSNTGTNSSGFTALPSGFRLYDGNFNYMGNRGGTWWSSTENNVESGVWTRTVDCCYYDEKDDYVTRESESKELGFSVRCIKNF